VAAGVNFLAAQWAVITALVAVTHAGSCQSKFCRNFGGLDFTAWIADTSSAMTRFGGICSNDLAMRMSA